MGPRTVDLPAYLVDRAPDLDAIVFFTYLYYPTVRGTGGGGRQGVHRLPPHRAPRARHHGAGL